MYSAVTTRDSEEETPISSLSAANGSSHTNNNNKGGEGEGELAAIDFDLNGTAAVLKRDSSMLLFVNDENGSTLDDDAENDAAFLAMEYGRMAVGNDDSGPRLRGWWGRLCPRCIPTVTFWLWRRRWLLSIFSWLIAFTLLILVIFRRTGGGTGGNPNDPGNSTNHLWHRLPLDVSSASDRLQLSDIFAERYKWQPSIETLAFHPHSDNLMFAWSSSSSDDLVLVDIQTSQVQRTIATRDLLESIGGKAIIGKSLSSNFIHPSPNHESVTALIVDQKNGWRYSKFYSYIVLDENNTFHPIVRGNGKFVSSFEWAPVPATSPWICSFVFENNLYVAQKDGDRVAYFNVTNDGADEIIFNGHTDWAYEEEIFNSEKASYWSLEGRFLAYVKFNDTAVRYFPYVKYGQDNMNFYPEVVNVRYPNAGTPNPIVTLHILDWQRKRLINVQGYAFGPENLVLREFVWISDEILLFRQLDRVQSIMHLSKIDLSAGNEASLIDQNRPFVINGVTFGTFVIDAKTIRLVDHSGKGWIDTVGSLTSVRLGANHYYLDLENEKTGFNQMFLSNVNGGIEIPVSLGSDYEVIKVIGYDESSGRIWFKANKEGPAQVHIYYVELKDGGDAQPIVSEMKMLVGQQVPGNHDAQFSAKFGFAQLLYKGPNIPSKAVIKVPLNDWNRSLSSLSTEVSARIKAAKLPMVEYFTIPGDDGFELVVKIFYPPSLGNGTLLRLASGVNEGYNGKKYPVLLEGYGGPLSSLTKMRYSQSDWAAYLASSQEIIVATTDGRGTDDRGRRFRWAIHHDLGNKEVDDQLTLARYLRGLPFVDPALIAIKGWSYGGYLAAKTMERNSDLVRIGISVAPVYSWKGYDSLYTERYMGFCDGVKGSESENRYERSRVHASKKAFSSTTSSYLLIQGTGDDNGNMRFQADLTDSGAFPAIQQRVMSDSNHGMSRGNDFIVVHEIMTEFLLDSFEKRSRQRSA